jgi:hypothetical protein
VLKYNKIQDNQASGFLVEYGQGTLEDYDIASNGGSGVEVMDGDNLILRSPDQPQWLRGRIDLRAWPECGGG